MWGRPLRRSILAVTVAAALCTCDGGEGRPAFGGSDAAIGSAQAQEPASDHAGHGALPGALAGSGDGTGRPIGLLYACGNRFIVTSAFARPVTLGYRVVGTGDAGSVRVAGAPDEDPGFSEAEFETRYQTLTFTRDATGLTVTGPTNRKITPPGHYMLFILNGAGVPSVATIIRIG